MDGLAFPHVIFWDECSPTAQHNYAPLTIIPKSIKTAQSSQCNFSKSHVVHGQAICGMPHPASVCAFAGFPAEIDCRGQVSQDTGRDFQVTSRSARSIQEDTVQPKLEAHENKLACDICSSSTLLRPQGNAGA